MNRNYQIVFLLIFFCGLIINPLKAQDGKTRGEHQQLYKNGQYSPYEVLDTRVDNMRYWKEVARLGLTETTPYREVPKGIFIGTKIDALSVINEDSPDVPVTTQNSTQSENSVFVDPTNPDHVLQSNNSTQNPVGSLYGANYFYSYNFGSTWGGSVQGAGGGNSGDPATAISLSGRQYVGFIHSNSGQGVSYSTNGTSWTSVIVDAGSGSSLLDKNHLWIDNSPVSPYEGNVHVAWTDFGGPNDAEIEFSYSSNDGLSYSTSQNISSAINAGSHNQGVNLQTGPNGEVYAVWAVYDSWPSDESTLGFAKSLNGGATWQPAERIISNIRGIRTSETSKNHRVNSFPSMACDIGGDGSIYIVWTNIGVPGINTGNDIDVYMIRSGDEGESWSAPIRVNQDASGQGNEHYFPWITCDPINSALSVVFYDDRNVGGSQCEVFCANSFDGGSTWEDFRVSDVSFTPVAIPGLAGGYMGDYLGISARGGKVYPVWTDNRSGVTMTYTSPYLTNTLARPENLHATLNAETGQVDLIWNFTAVPGFEYFIIYRDDVQIGTTTAKLFTDFLPDYGLYEYTLTAMHSEGESAAVLTSLQWGDAQLAVDPASFNLNIQPGTTSATQLTISNAGQLDLIFDVSSSTEPIRGRDYCPATTSNEDEFISNVSFGEINNSSTWQGGVADYTDQSTDLEVGASENIVVTNGNAWASDRVTVWVDWDSDFEFETATNEEFVLINVGGTGQTFTGSITAPQGTQSGEKRMRVRMTYSSAPAPCNSSSYGEVEDYTINVSGWLLVDNVSGTLAPGQSQAVDIQLDATDLALGTYTGNIHIQSNDPDTPVLDVPLTLNVAIAIPLSLNVTANPETITQGESSQLNALPQGGSGAYTYSWTSSPAGFSSSIANPVHSPQETTTYFVEVNDGTQTVSGSAMVTVESATLTQDISLLQGWNIISSRIVPGNPDMLSVVQPLIDDDLLYKVIDEQGGTVFYLPFPPPGHWNNSIGDIDPAEGYYMKVNAATTLSLSGTPADLPLTINLHQGWNMISYPCEQAQNALALVQPLIDAGVLYKVIAQNGGVIFYLPFPEPGHWANSIGDFQAGQGYYVKVSEDINLTIENPAKANQTFFNAPVAHKPVFFETIFPNNPYQPMAIAVKTSSWMEPGDEIAVFDGDICVGVSVFTNHQEDFIIIPVGMDDSESEEIEGARAGNDYSIRLWNRNSQTLYDAIDFDYLQGSFDFALLETALIELNPLLTQMQSLDKPVKISLHPNPMREEAVLEFALPKSAFATIHIYDGMGSLKARLAKRWIDKSESLKLNKSDLHLEPGVYTMQIILSDTPGANPLVRVIKFVVY